MAYCNLDKVIYNGIGKFDIPKIEPITRKIDVSRWIGFNYAKSLKYCQKDFGVHFCLDDYQFETIWNHSNKYIENFKRCGCILSPDFSLYSDFPKAIQIYNHYRKHWLARFYQDRGVNVIPTIAWSDEESFEWCFDGEPKDSIVAVSTIGVKANKENFEAFKIGYNEMIRRLSPKKIICLTSTEKFEEIKLDGDIEFYCVSTFVNKMNKGLK